MLKVSPFSLVALLAAVGGAWWLACSTPSKDGPIRSPSHDYGREPPRASDGTVIGADGMDPADRPRLGQETGWSLDDDGRPRFSEERLRSGGHAHPPQPGQQKKPRGQRKPAPVTTQLPARADAGV